MTDSGAPVATGRERLIEVTLLTGQSLSNVSGWEDPRTESRGALGFDEGAEDTGAEDSLLILHTTELKMWLPPRGPVLQFRGDRRCPRDSPYGRLAAKGEQDGPSGALARPPPGPRLLEQLSAEAVSFRSGVCSVELYAGTEASVLLRLGLRCSRLLQAVPRDPEALTIACLPSLLHRSALLL
ncbi:hypothetical protein NDU88_003715 [Pleurodeles waltl]|uniref:Uncharacterized protein n=1 Tax=Pleurodeles waltl TaxID=8319 RepID=A0AAV7LGC0_PLEWA|nr:hypothetical protein NDU88_003715 [Pleurodeles waltl]